MWNRGVFALKPLKLSRDRKKLTVQFFWQVPGNHKIDSRIDLLTEPTSSEGLEIVANGQFLSRLENDGSGPHIRPIQSGELFIFTTEDPKNYRYQAWNSWRCNGYFNVWWECAVLRDGQAWMRMTMTLSIMTIIGSFRTIPIPMYTTP